MNWITILLASISVSLGIGGLFIDSNHRRFKFWAAIFTTLIILSGLSTVYQQYLEEMKEKEASIKEQNERLKQARLKEIEDSITKVRFETQLQKSDSTSNLLLEQSKAMTQLLNSSETQEARLETTITSIERAGFLIDQVAMNLSDLTRDFNDISNKLFYQFDEIELSYAITIRDASQQEYYSLLNIPLDSTLSTFYSKAKEIPSDIDFIVSDNWVTHPNYTFKHELGQLYFDSFKSLGFYIENKLDERGTSFGSIGFINRPTMGFGRLNGESEISNVSMHYHYAIGNSYEQIPEYVFEFFNNSDLVFKFRPVNENLDLSLIEISYLSITLKNTKYEQEFIWSEEDLIVEWSKDPRSISIIRATLDEEKFNGSQLEIIQ